MADLTHTPLARTHTRFLRFAADMSEISCLLYSKALGITYAKEIEGVEEEDEEEERWRGVIAEEGETRFIP